MIRKTVAMSLILAAGICAYRGSSPYIEARMEQEYLKQAAFPGNEGKLSEEDERKGNDPTREETVPYTSPIDFEALKSINPDIVGWIQIPGTVIDYPICWRDGDNEYYMTHSAEGEKRAFGAIMLDGANSSAAEEHLVVLYGHHMRNGTMFKDIVRYTDASYILVSHSRSSIPGEYVLVADRKPFFVLSLLTVAPLRMARDQMVPRRAGLYSFILMP